MRATRTWHRVAQRVANIHSDDSTHTRRFLALGRVHEAMSGSSIAEIVKRVQSSAFGGVHKQGAGERDAIGGCTVGGKPYLRCVCDDGGLSPREAAAKGFSRHSRNMKGLSERFDIWKDKKKEILKEFVKVFMVDSLTILSENACKVAHKSSGESNNINPPKNYYKLF